MARFRKLENKQPDIAIGAADILLHAVSLLDIVGVTAAERMDTALMFEVYNGLLDASDRLMSLATAEQHSEGIIEDDRERNAGEFGFQHPAEPEPREGDIEALSKSRRLQQRIL